MTGITKQAAEKLGLESALAARTLAHQLVFNYDLSKPGNAVLVDPVAAKLEQATVVFRPNALADLQTGQQRRLSGTAAGQYKPHGAVLLIDQIALDINVSGNKSWVDFAAVPPGESMQLRNFLVPGLVMDVSWAQLEEAIQSEPFTLEAGPLLDMEQRPKAVRSTLGKHLAERLCLHPDAHTSLDFTAVSARVPLTSEGTGELVLHSVSWDVVPDATICLG